MAKMKCANCDAELEILETKYSQFLKRNLYVLEECTNCAEIEKKRLEEEKRSDSNYQIIENRQNCNLPLKFANYTFDKFVAPSDSYETAMKRSIAYCKVAEKIKKRGMGIYFVGKVGTGKTTMMSCMINQLLNDGYSCYINNFIDIARNMFDDKNDKFFKMIRDVDFMFLDDIGTERYVTGNSEESWINERIYELIDYRNKNLKCTIFSSNLTYNELLEKGLMKKTVDRIVEMTLNAEIEIKTPKSLRLK